MNKRLIEHKKLPLFFKRWFFLFAYIISAFSIIALFGQYHHYLELFSHFRYQYFLASLFSLVIVVVYKSRKTTVLMLLVVALNVYEILPWYLAPDQSQKVENSTKLKLLLSNVLTSNTQYQDLLDLIDNEKPDIVVLQEVNDMWLEAVSSLEKEFPYSKIISRNDNFGIAVYSQFELKNTEIFYVKQYGVPSILTEVIIDNGQIISLIASHPLPPINASLYNSRNTQYKLIASLLNTIENPKIVIGDLNTTMWSSDYKQFISEASLRNSRKGFGVNATWPTFFPLAGIPLDHCLVSKEFLVSDFKKGGNIGSDHLPIIVELVL